MNKQLAEDRGAGAGFPAAQEDAGHADTHLLEEFLNWRSEAAFATLVARHGPMVLGVCRRFLPNAHDAEDACQATFLVLVRKADSIRRRELLANWLYGVAHKIAARARIRKTRQPQVLEADITMAFGPPKPEMTDPDLQRVLHEEVNRLPARYRAPIVLCYLEGKTNEEAAQQSRCPVGTIKGRLARARDLLRARLLRRGLALSTTMVAASLAEGAAQANLPATLFEATVTTALQFAKGGPIPLPVHILAQSFLRNQYWAGLKIGMAGIVVLTLVVAGSFVLFMRPRAQDPVPNQKEIDRQTSVNPDLEKIQGNWKAVSMKVNGMELPNDGGPNINDVRWEVGPGTISSHMFGFTTDFVYQLGPALKCKTIDLRPVDRSGRSMGETEPGVYELKGDTLTICKPLEPNRPRPTEVESRPDSGTMAIVFKRQPPDLPDNRPP